MPAAAAGAVVSTELQQSIFNVPPSAATSLPQKPPEILKVQSGESRSEETKGPETILAGQKRARDEEGEPEQDSEGDVPMEEDSDDD